MLKTGICLRDTYYNKSPFQSLQQTLYNKYLDFENGDLFLWYILEIPFSEPPANPVQKKTRFWKRGFGYVIHTIYPLFRTSSKPYTQLNLILKTGICLCDSYYNKSPFQNIQQTIYKNSLILKTGICLCDSCYNKSPFQNLQQTIYIKMSLFWKRGFVCVIHAINPLFRTSSKSYTKNNLLLKTGNKSPFQNLQ